MLCGIFFIISSVYHQCSFGVCLVALKRPEVTQDRMLMAHFVISETINHGPWPVLLSETINCNLLIKALDLLLRRDYEGQEQHQQTLCNYCCSPDHPIKDIKFRALHKLNLQIKVQGCVSSCSHLLLHSKRFGEPG